MEQEEGGGGGASTGWNGPRGEVSQCGSAASKEKEYPDEVERRGLVVV